MKFPVKEEQKIFIEMQGMFINKVLGTFEGKIVKVNTRSFYVKSIKGREELRFDKKTGISKGIACYYEAYPDKETYDGIVKRKEQRKKLQHEISMMISKLDLDDLLKIEEYIKEIIRGQ
jgi:hypothetical protein